MVAEYRALRASVIRLWTRQKGELLPADVEDLTRFNEAIDQSLAESVTRYTEELDHSKEMFLAILGHDLRSPLATVSMAGAVLARGHAADTAVGAIALRLLRSAASMTTMVNDLLEYSRTQLGGAIPIESDVQDMAPACAAAIDAAQAAHPECAFLLEVDGDLVCNFDYERLQQVFSNLLNNAAQYSPPGEPVSLRASGDPDAVFVQVSNRGRVIPGNALAMIFNPLVQLAPAPEDRGRPSTSIGLGLFIAREITQAHGGSIGVESSEEDGTVFTVRIPRALTAQEMGRIQASV
jgi:signal transduction histidine kinase